ncbi:MAG: dUTP diphosphatase [Eubacterium ventriosum]
MAVNVNVKKLKENATIPTYGTEYAAGADLYACIEEAVTIEAGETKFIGTGIAMEIPEGYAGLIYARSGLSCKRGLAPANKVGVVDADYRGELTVALHNHSNKAETIEPNERIAQVVITPFLSAILTGCPWVTWHPLGHFNSMRLFTLCFKFFISTLRYIFHTHNVLLL